MKIILKDNQFYVLRFDKNDEVIEGLTRFCADYKINAAAFWGIGAAKEIVLSYYEIDNKEYRDEKFGEKLEIASLMGNVASLKSESESESGKVIVHAHGSFSDSKMRLAAGHVKELIVSATCEVFLIAPEGKLEREYSNEIGLNLFK